jgi:hypothetical protein
MRQPLALQTVNSMILLLCALSGLADSYFLELVTILEHICGKNVRQTSFECFCHSQPCSLSVDIKFLYTHSDSKTSIIQRQNSLLFDVLIRVFRTFRMAVKLSFVP